MSEDRWFGHRVQKTHWSRQEYNHLRDFTKGLLLTFSDQESCNRSEDFKRQHPLFLQGLWSNRGQRWVDVGDNWFQKGVQLSVRDSERPFDLCQRRQIWQDVHGWRFDPLVVLHNLKVLHWAWKSTALRFAFINSCQQDNQKRWKSSRSLELHNWNNQVFHALKQRSLDWICQQQNGDSFVAHDYKNLGV